MTALITGGAGFIGSHLVDLLISKGQKVVVVDKLTYASDIKNLDKAYLSALFTFICEDVCNAQAILQTLKDHSIQTVYHLAAESHVDNSIHEPSPFIETNINGTYSMLSASLKYWEELGRFKDFRFIHVSTDEVFGCLRDEDPAFNEETPYAPNSPYSASKAAGDHLARAWNRTYGLPVIITNCSNNFGTRQHKEKLIPTIIKNALQGNPIPIYGTGKNIRDWIFVKDHCVGINLAAIKGTAGECYCFGGKNEKQNIQIASEICKDLDYLCPRTDGQSYHNQIAYVEDRKGHDWRYAIDSSKATKELGYHPSKDTDGCFKETIKYYL